MDLQLTPPQIHRRNWAERAIQTGKAHLIAGLVGINPNFPLHLWCRSIPQCEQTLNMMRPTHITLEHYRCFDIWCPDTRRVRQGETARFFSHDHVLPGLSPHENITLSIHELISALRYPHPASPTATFGKEQTQALIQLARIMNLALPVKPPTSQQSS